MTTCSVTFKPFNSTVHVPVGTLVLEAVQQARLEVNIPCGGQGRCGRCTVIVEDGQVQRRSSLRLSPADLARGYALAFGLDEKTTAFQKNLVDPRPLLKEKLAMETV